MGVVSRRPRTRLQFGGRCEFADFGDTHNDLRSAASALSGSYCPEDYASSVSSTTMRNGRPFLTSITGICPVPIWFRCSIRSRT